jgi:flavin reductase (DIM6/NTAB) family NADH-FMN oxidoreductase RutF/DNA-binding IclR family transcriptional regulator
MSGAEPTFDTQWFRRVLGQYPTGVCVVTGMGEDGRPAGLVMGSFTSVSLDPPLVAFLPDKSSSSWPRIAPSGKFCINVLAGDQEDVCRRFASKAPDKFEGYNWRAGRTGSPVLEHVVAWIDCELEVIHETGDHWLVIGRVVELDVERNAPPLLFYQGGYGSFQPLSYVTEDEDLAGQMFYADRSRADMEAIALDTGMQVRALALVRDEIVLVASAGEAPADEPALIGTRVPALPPVGSTWLAHADEQQVAGWLRLADPADHDEHRARLVEVRERGWSVALVGPVYDELTALAVEARERGAENRLATRGREIIPTLPLDPLGYTLEDPAPLLELYAPVFAPDGHVALLLALSGFAPDASHADKQAALDRLLAGARAATEKVGGAPPA